ncbi:MAG: 1-acyl-sn-glycerol-3-phosphate acyltransferase [bacterium]|nr:1-acyl-sn-glycerol-3-phosphate acyltransferase [bacterium]MCP5069890.1 1-acyl-sn-glycerol-3-phosphate acyltransferase [bacterium]
MGRWFKLKSRQLRTGLAFAYYGLGALVITLWLGLRRLLGVPAGRDAAQRILRRSYDSFVRLMVALDLFRLHNVGTDALVGPGPRLIVVNHPSAIDSALVVRHLPQADNFMSPTWARVPLIRSVGKAVAFIPSDAAQASVDEAVERLRAGRTVVMFPEGTRSPRNGLGHFARGAAHIALRSGCDLLPVVIRMDPPILKKGERWYEVPDRTPDVELRVMPPFSPGKVLDGTEPPMLAARKLTAALRGLYMKVLELD